MTTRKSHLETDNNQVTAKFDAQRTVLITESRKAEKYHKALAGTFTACGRTNAEFEQRQVENVPDEYGPCVKCFDLPEGAD